MSFATSTRGGHLTPYIYSGLFSVTRSVSYHSLFILFFIPPISGGWSLGALVIIEVNVGCIIALGPLGVRAAMLVRVGSYLYV